MYINSNHIRIVKLIQNISNINLEFMGEILNTGEHNVILYIRTVYKFLYPESETFKRDEMIEAIKTCPGLVETLKKQQEITKEERISFIIFSLLLKEELNLSEVANFFSVTRRSLNNDIQEVKEMLSRWNLGVESLNFKGVKVIGDRQIRRKLFNNYIYKAKIELNELPEMLQEIYSEFFESMNYEKLLEESKKFISFMDLDRFFHINDIYATFAIAFADPHSKERKIRDIENHEEFHTLSKESFSLEYSQKLFSSLKETVFGNFPVEFIRDLVLFIKMSSGELYMNDPDIMERTSQIKEYIGKKMNLAISGMGEYDFHISRMIFFSMSSFDIKLKDFNFLFLNINETISKEIIEIYLYLRKEMYNASFSVILNLYLHLSGLRDYKEKDTSRIYLLYKIIPAQMFPILQRRLQKIYGITILGFVDIAKIDSFLEESEADSFVVLEKFIYKNPEVEIRYLPFPL